MLLGLVLMTFPMLLSCNEKDSIEPIDSNHFKVYSVVDSRLKAINIEYVPEKEEKDIKQLFKYIKNGNDSMDSTIILSDLELEKVVIEGDDVLIYFNESYYNLEPLEELLVRCAIAKTLTEIKDITSVKIFVDGEPLVDSDGQAVGDIYGKDIVVSVDEFNLTQVEKVNLYFKDDKLNKLRLVTSEIEVNKNESLEKAMLNTLIRGLPDEGYASLLPQEVVVKSVSTYKGICYIDFNNEFIVNHVSRETELAVYSIVNTMTELSYINKVQFFVEGQKVEELYGGTDLSGLLKRNHDIVIK